MSCSPHMHRDRSLILVTGPGCIPQQNRSAYVLTQGGPTQRSERCGGCGSQRSAWGTARMPCAAVNAPSGQALLETGAGEGEVRAIRGQSVFILSRKKRHVSPSTGVCGCVEPTVEREESRGQGAARGGCTSLCEGLAFSSG